MWGVVGDVALDGGNYLWEHFPFTTIRVVNMQMDPWQMMSIFSQHGALTSKAILLFLMWRLAWHV